MSSNPFKVGFNKSEHYNREDRRASIFCNPEIMDAGTAQAGI